MKVIRNKKELSEYVSKWKKNGLKIGFVPTMGALHSGHLSLIDAAKSECQIAVCSVFVNPTQFNNSNDLSSYPTTLDEDKKLLEKHSCDLLFAPSPQEMYPEGLKSQSYSLGGIDMDLEGEMRPGHFDGVCTVVHKLLDLTKADIAYFGEKDVQQLCVVTKMAKTLQLPVVIKGCPTIRESDGLAKSSRNELLTTQDRQSAGNIYKAMMTAKKNYSQKTLLETISQVKNDFLSMPNSKIDYVEIVHAADLRLLTAKDKNQPALLVVALFLGEVRLIDNVNLNE